MPALIRRPESELRRAHVSAVHERDVAADPDQAAPRAGAYHRADLLLLEEPWERIAPRSRKFVHDHDLRPVDRANRPLLILAFTGCQEIQQPAVQLFGEEVGNKTAAVVA